MAGGLVGLLDDVATLAKLAASSLDDVGAAATKATSKAAGVVIDDTAVTPQYVQGLAAERELPIIRRIATGSFRNKLLIIIPVALLLSELLPGLLTPILMLGGAYLSYEATHKIFEALTGHAPDGHGSPDRTDPAEAPSEDEVVAGAVRTDLILSAEIMVIALDEIAAETLFTRAAVLVVVAVIITLLVYGVVAVIVKMDDVGLRLAQGEGATAEFGRRLVTAMPRLLSVMAVVGTGAMLWVGGHIELVGLDEFGLSLPYDVVHHLEEAVREAVPALGGLLAWVVNTIGSALLGLVVGAVLVAAQTAWTRRRGGSTHAA